MWGKYSEVLDTYIRKSQELSLHYNIRHLGTEYQNKARAISAHESYRESRKKHQSSTKKSFPSLIPDTAVSPYSLSRDDPPQDASKGDFIPKSPTVAQDQAIKASIDELIQKIKESTPKQYIAINRDEIGLKGELFILGKEQSKLADLDHPYLDKIIHVSQNGGDHFGFDILSFNESQKPLLIEVKTTKGGPETPFFLTANELKTLNDYEDSYIIARVFHFDVENMTGEVAYLTASEVLNNHKLEPQIYRLKPI